MATAGYGTTLTGGDLRELYAVSDTMEKKIRAIPELESGLLGDAPRQLVPVSMLKPTSETGPTQSIALFAVPAMRT